MQRRNCSEHPHLQHWKLSISQRLTAPIGGYGMLRRMVFSRERDLVCLGSPSLELAAWRLVLVCYISACLRFGQDQLLRAQAAKRSGLQALVPEFPLDQLGDQ